MFCSTISSIGSISSVYVYFGFLPIFLSCIQSVQFIKFVTEFKVKIQFVLFYTVNFTLFRLRQLILRYDNRGSLRQQLFLCKQASIINIKRYCAKSACKIEFFDTLKHSKVAIIERQKVATQGKVC